MFTKTTESTSLYDDLENKSTIEMLSDINREDQKVALAVQDVLPQIENLVNAAFNKLANAGRLFYIGAGTSGRLGILDASECPPTYGVSPDLVIGLIAGGDGAIRKSVEHAEDNADGAWQDLKKYEVDESDFVIGIAASGTTPYVIGGLKKCREKNILTASITCNAGSPVANQADYPIEVVVGPEYVTGSTRMKAGTAQKLVLNMISTSLMIKLGRVKGNKMVDMKLSNSKLVDRGVKMIIEKTGFSYEEAHRLLTEKKSVRAVLDDIKKEF